MKIYTKTGDQGKTSLIGGSRVDKSHSRIEAYGTVDELNAHIGLLSDLKVNQSRQEFLRKIQNNLFNIGSYLALEDQKVNIKLEKISEKEVKYLEQQIDKMSKNLPVMKNFVLPGGAVEVSSCHIARTVCRRTERRVVSLQKEQEIDHVIMIYLNRLSDYLFVLCRQISSELGAVEIPWNPKSEN